MIDLSSKSERMNNIYRIVDRNGQSIRFKLNAVQQAVLDNIHKRNLILKARQLGMCLDPNTLVLKADFTWVKIGELKIGDEIIGVDETPRCQGSARKLRRGLVQGIKRHSRKAYRITFDNGKTLICTGEHRWLARNSATDYHWRSIEGEGTQQLKVGNKIRRIVPDTWEQGDFEDGWIGGMLDGEGSLSLKSRLGGNIGISQVEGAVFRRLERYFHYRKYNYRIEIDKAERPSKFGKRPVNKIVVSRTNEIMKLIGITRPSRFIDRDWWEGKKVPQIMEGNYSTIVNIECIGKQEVIDLQTSTKTFIAEGYVSHNSTFSVLFILDEAIFNHNVSCGIVSYSLEHAQHIFKRIIGHALDNLDEPYKKAVRVAQRSAREITFENGSFLRVDTSLRGGSYQNVLVSEFGKTCARNPIKAEEVVTGTLNTLSQSSTCIIESTGEGNSGFFADMVNISAERGNDNLTDLNYRLFFFNWLQEPTYRMKHNIPEDYEKEKYFEKLETELSCTITRQQRNWYYQQASLLGDKVKQEFPSTVSEAFLSSSDAYYFQQGIQKAYDDNRCLYNSLYDALAPVYVAMDIGVTDLTVLTFFQVVHGEIRIIDYYEDNNKDTSFYCKFLLQDKPYLYETIFLPHDSAHKGKVIVDNTYEREVRKYFSHTPTKVHVLKVSVDKNLLISNARIKLDRCVFNLHKTKSYLEHLSKYRKKWSEQYGKYLDSEHKDINCHYADSFSYSMQAVTHIEALGDVSGALEKHRRAVETRG